MNRIVRGLRAATAVLSLAFISSACSGSNAVLPGSNQPATPVPRTVQDKPGQSVFVVPSSLTFASATAPSQTFIGEQDFAGVQTAVVSAPACASVSPTSAEAVHNPRRGDKTVTYTVTPLAAGNCTITVTDKKGNTAAVAITVSHGPPNTNSNIYYTFNHFNGAPGPQIAIVSYPLTVASIPTVINGNATNMLDVASELLFDASGRLWVFTQQPPCCINNVIQVFSLPLTQTSSPLFTLTLTGVGVGTNNVLGGALDSNGNLWAVSGPFIYKYAGPFNSTATISPALTLSDGLSLPRAIAFDASGHLFVTNNGNAGTNAVTRYDPPITDGMTASAQLNGIAFPGGIAFDSAGNLYVGGRVPSGGPGAVFRYNSGNLVNGAVPNITDSTANPSGATTLAFDSSGNLYDADCGSTPTIFVYPTAMTSFSSTLLPSVVFTQTVANSDCVWGLVIR